MRSRAIKQCVEVASVSRPVADKGKGKGKEKEKPKAADRGNDKEPTSTYEYLDGSVHDISLREDILRGYERFKASTHVKV